MEDFILQDNELAGFDVGGYALPNGTIKLISGRFIDKFPEEIYHLGNTYELEDVIKSPVDEKTGIQWQNAQYA